MEEDAVESVEYSHEVPHAPEEQEDFSQAADMINPPRGWRLFKRNIPERHEEISQINIFNPNL